MDLGDKYDITALFVAAERQQTAMCEELIGLGADPNYGIEADIIKPRLHLVKGIVRPPHTHPQSVSQIFLEGLPILKSAVVALY